MEMALNPTYVGVQRAEKAGLRPAPRQRPRPVALVPPVRQESCARPVQYRRHIGLWRAGFLAAHLLYYTMAVILCAPMACADTLKAIPRKAQ